MVVDTSAILAIALDEPEAAHFIALLLQPPKPFISAGTLIELSAVAVRRFAGALDARLHLVLTSIAHDVMPVTAGQADIARTAYRAFGIGSGHPARLNFGDCFAYALAKATGEPLLFKGDDFGRTDIPVVL